MYVYVKSLVNWSSEKNLTKMQTSTDILLFVFTRISTQKKIRRTNNLDPPTEFCSDVAEKIPTLGLIQIVKSFTTFGFLDT